MQRVVSMMDRQMTHIVRLVDDLLDVSRITRGKLELRRQKVPLANVLASAIEATRALIERNGHELVVDLRAEGLAVHGDPDRLAQVFSNLLSNSAKYTDRGGRIVLTLERAPNEAIVSVRDNGRGIPSEELEHIFDMFVQLRSAGGPHGHEGLGIGLSLVRSLVQMHGGSIRALSEGAGGGSTFVVRLPLVETQVTAQRIEFVEGDASRGAGKRVLVVDDNEDAAATLAILLQTEGSDVRIAADGEQAIQLTREFAPEIIFMDISMPQLDGIEATRCIRALPLTERPFIVALTGLGQSIDRLRTSDAGMDYHLVKPASREELQEAMAQSERG